MIIALERMQPEEHIFNLLTNIFFFNIQISVKDRLETVTIGINNLFFFFFSSDLRLNAAAHIEHVSIRTTHLDQAVDKPYTLECDLFYSKVPKVVWPNYSLKVIISLEWF